ncbi:hypothetical protein, partial [Neisseria sicca]
GIWVKLGVIGGENSRKPVFGFRLLEEKKFCKGLSGLNLNQDKARQRRTGLKLIHYKIRMTVTKRSSEKSTSTEIPIYNPLDTLFQTTSQGGSIIQNQTTMQSLHTRHPRIFSFMRLKNLSDLRQIPINPKY